MGLEGEFVDLPLSKQVFMSSLTMSPFWVPPTVLSHQHLLGSIAIGKGERPHQRSVHKRHLGYSQPSTVAKHRNTLCVSIAPHRTPIKRR